MKFQEYLKSCRQRYKITQEAFVNHLYTFDALFFKLDVVTLSRWERGVTTPNLERQKKIIESLRHYSSDVFPAFDLIDIEALKQKNAFLCVSKVTGKHKRYVLNFPQDLIESSNVNIVNMKESPSFEITLKFTYELHKKITNNYSNLNLAHFQLWASHPKSFFALSNYEENFFGMSFSLQLNKQTFDSLLSEEMKESTISLDNFAKEDEKSYEYMLGFFAYSEESASLLLLEYYQHLIRHQHSIQEVGSLVKIEEGHALVKSIGLTNLSSKAYANSIEDVLLSPVALSILFEKFVIQR